MSTAPNLSEAVRLAIVANTDLLSLGITAAVVWNTFAPTAVNPTGPWIVFEAITLQETGSQDGDDGLENARYQLTIGGTNPVAVDKVQRVLARQFNGLDFTYVESTVPYIVHFFQNGGNASPWEPNQAVYKLSVDFEVWIQTKTN